MIGERASLQIMLYPESVTRVRGLARFPVLRGDHVTLAHAEEVAKFNPSWIPAGLALGSSVSLSAVGECADDRVQALLVEIGGTRLRPWDGGILHVTVSRQPWARSHESNWIVHSVESRALSLTLRGQITWQSERD